jgi:arylsulfatase A-like enzyme
MAASSRSVSDAGRRFGKTCDVVISITELYDLQQDPSESHNLADEHPERVAALEAMMSQVRTPSEDFPLVPLDEPAN